MRSDTLISGQDWIKRFAEFITVVVIPVGIFALPSIAMSVVVCFNGFFFLHSTLYCSHHGQIDTKVYSRVELAKMLLHGNELHTIYQTQTTIHHLR